MLTLPYPVDGTVFSISLPQFRNEAGLPAARQSLRTVRRQDRSASAAS
ncbi:MAG: hypothetical protein JNM43_21265 [Planctomycetaceae bacterium]|nr:hypothetical protein [Planctomycetaceae bacterium]